MNDHRDQLGNAEKTMDFTCPHCFQHLEITESNDFVDCPECGHEFRVPDRQDAVQEFELAGKPEALPTLKVVSDYTILGPAIMIIGLIAIFIYFPFGILAGIMLILLGKSISIKRFCGNCGKRLRSRKIPHCPHCKVSLHPPSQ
jgi:DNA-directed RNA polymerase subunit RPC12/RpoP